MNDLDRFLAVAHFEKPDYIPIFGNHGAPGFSMGAQKPGHAKLVREGMPSWVGGVFDGGGFVNLETWQQYWGVTSPDAIDFFPAGRGGPGIRQTRRVEGEYEIIEEESGAITRQVLNNDDIYSMPEFIRYPVRDRDSWEFFKQATAPGPMWEMDRIRDACRKFENRTRPLVIHLSGTWGNLRNLAGTELAATMLYDDPELAHEIIDHFCGISKRYMYPLIEILKPEIVATSEDNCYNGGMMISPAQFREFCAPYYTETAELCRSSGVSLMEVDTDGNAMKFVPEIVRCGFNGLFPFECKAGNDLFKIRERFPDFIMMGWLEKEVVNDGNESLIEEEIMSKVPPLIKTGGYFPNCDHGIQPDINFRNFCKFMTILHEVTDNPEGLFPRM